MNVDSDWTVRGTLRAKWRRSQEDEWIDLGVVSERCVTTAFVDLVTDYLQGSGSDIGDFAYHDFGTGTNAEAITDTALQTPTAESRETGTQMEGITANVYQSAATHTFAGTFSITEWGLFNAATVGVLLDRAVFAAISVVLGSQIAVTYDLTFTPGG